ncbi:Sulfate/thiosulfate import ATP-binding protein CysA (plasmid) [Variovorax sp. SRS16]|uniref:ABC transporter ATP-binding protein n=1 Tax=Variovorax sp. SRS16 TaxID=282217 RepID=UPI0013198114|nr:ABC transporter ATP-binding protein [Variovorax sp. SRS16]VTU46700.1 Sulfate/thiosulfate import ATP-binding protein CysA [Variovorax sp. SRS16]
MSALLELRNVSKRYGGVAAVNKVSFSVSRGQFLGLMGANGAGKTTLFSLIAGNQGISEGEILLRGQSIVGKRPDQICALGVARTFQIVRPFRDMSALENVYTAALFNVRTSSPAQARSAAERALEVAGLASVKECLAGDLTLSKQKRLELARALATGGELLLLDEIMAGLTPSEVEEMLVTLKDIHREFSLTVICVEHVMRALMRLSDEIVVLHYGEVMAQGRPQEVADNPDVIRNYFGAA